MLKAVITTIQEPTAAVRALAAALQHEPGALIVVGERKGRRASSWRAAPFCRCSSSWSCPTR